MSGLGQALETIEGALDRLDQRRASVSPARLEISRATDRGRLWVAQIVADPLSRPVVASDLTSVGALEQLAAEVDLIDWRRVRR